MKKFLFKLAPFIAFILILEIGIPMYVDPYNIFHWSEIRDNGVEPNGNYIKMEYILHHPDRFDSFLFGSSRTGFIDVSRIPNGTWYNMSYSEGVPDEHYENLLELIEQGIIPKNVMIGIDNISCFVDPGIHEEQFYRIPYPRTNKLNFYANYFSIKGVFKSLDVITNHKIIDPEYVTRFYETGNSKRDLVVDNNWESNDAPYWEEYYENQFFNCVLVLNRIKDLCEEYDINFILFTNPIYYKTYQESEHYGYEVFLKELSESMDFYNFSSINELSSDHNNYIESSHFNMGMGDRVIDRIFYEKRDSNLENQGFGYYVTKDNFDDFSITLDAY